MISRFGLLGWFWGRQLPSIDADTLPAAEEWYLDHFARRTA